MKRFTCALVVAIGIIAMSVALDALRPASFVQLTVPASITAFPAINIRPNGAGSQAASVVSCRLRLAEVSWTTDPRTTVSATVGTLLKDGETLTFAGTELIDAFRAFRTTGTSGQLDCHFYFP